VTTTVELPVLDLQIEADLWVPECEVWFIVEDRRCGAAICFLIHIFCPECQEWRWGRMCAGCVERMVRNRPPRQLKCGAHGWLMSYEEIEPWTPST